MNTDKKYFRTLCSAAILILTIGCVNAAMLVDFSADTGVTTAANNIVTSWDDQSGNGFNATPLPDGPGAPVLTTAVVNGRSHPVLQFNGSSILTAPSQVPPTGTIFLVLSNTAPPGDTRVIGWGDACGGFNGIDISPNYGAGSVNVIARHNWDGGDNGMAPIVSDLEVITASWGTNGVTVERRLANGEVLTVPANMGITSVGNNGYSLHIGASGDLCAGLFQGNIAALRVYDEQLSEADRIAVASTLYSYWIGQRFAGTPGQANCHGKSVSALPPQVKGGLKQAAIALGFNNVNQLQNAISAYCGN